jgi:sulfite exporter TauE/SafE
VIELVVAAAVLGLGVAPHCAVMCGPVAARACAARGASRLESAPGYVIGRLTSYSLVGVIVGTFGGGLLTQAASPLRIVAIELVALFLLAEGLRLIAPGWFAAGSLGRISENIARRIPQSGLGLGLATGLFPCGALISAVLLAAISGNGLSGAAVMAVFSFASLPGVLAPSLAIAWFGRRGAGDFTARFARAGGALLIVLAVWVGARPLFAVSATSGEGHCAEHGTAPWSVHTEKIER